MQRQAYIAALNWHIDQGIDDVLDKEAYDKTVMPELPKRTEPKEQQETALSRAPAPAKMMLGAADAFEEALRLAQQAKDLKALEQVIRDFDGLELKKTAMNMVFADGNPKAKMMVVGEAPGADEDRQGKPFVGVSGQLLDKILAAIGYSRTEDNVEKAVYISNILNWRPPGNRTPSDSEIMVSLPFIEKHIALIQPDVLVLAGGVAAKALLGKAESISRLRGKIHDYVPNHPQLFEGIGRPVKALATYHPSYLLRTPAQKKLVWQDMLKLASHMDLEAH